MAEYLGQRDSMRLRFAVPSTIALAALVVYVSWLSRIDLWPYVSVCLGALVAGDLWRHRVHVREHRFPLHPVAALLIVGLFWPAALPWYLSSRSATHASTTRSTARRVLAGVALAVPLVATALLLLLARATPKQRKSVEALQGVWAAVQKESALPVTLLLSDRNLILQVHSDTMSAQTDTVTARVQGRRLAYLAYWKLPTRREAQSVEVVYVRTFRTGPFLASQVVARFRWWTIEFDPSIAGSHVPSPVSH
jgi:hypothetical protein